MARKPTRFWHPARRLLRNARETIFAHVLERGDAPRLEDVRVRLQLYLRAMYGETVLIETLAPPKKRGLVQRTLQQLALGREQRSSESDAGCIRLPDSLPSRRSSTTPSHHSSTATSHSSNTEPSPHSGSSPLEQYRVIAVHHAERMRRASARHAREVTSDLERDLYELAESATIDAQIFENQPGLRAALETARAESVAERPTPRFRTGIELRVEQMLRGAWSLTDTGRTGQSTSATATTSVPLKNNAESNATWARRTAVALESEFGRKAAREYRRVPEITLCQTTIRSTLPDEAETALETESRQTSRELQQDEWNSQSRSLLPGTAKSQASSKRQGQQSKEARSDDKSAGAEPQSTRGREVEDGAADGTAIEENSTASTQQRDREQKSIDAGAQEPSADQSAGGNGTQGVTHSDITVDDAMLSAGNTFHYPEWDCTLQRFTPTGATVRVLPSSLESADWATNMLHAHAHEIHRAKRQFEILRSHRLRLRRQEQGDELDLEACVEAMVDRRMQVALPDRLYSQVRPGRRELAITLLIDISGSTGEVIDGQQRVIDIERISALIAAAAFDALGDDYNILAFSSAGPLNVRVHTLKEFSEKNSTLVLQRIGALVPHGATRLGAAVRHATATLTNHPAPHRLLLILTDGKPHDYDWYFTDYAIQDSRQAIINARLQGIHPFCITVDTSDSEDYLADIFGLGGYRVVSKPSQLSQALLLAVRRLLAGAS